MRTRFRSVPVYGRFILIILIAIMVIYPSIQQQSVNAQGESPSTLRVLVSGVDINGQGFPLSILDLGSGNARTLLTFANRSVCPPSVFLGGEILLYELSDAVESYVYQVQVGTGDRELLTIAEDRMLSCPSVAPDGSAVAWLESASNSDIGNGEPQTTLVVIDVVTSEVTELASHPTIFDVQWSPRGGVLVYHSIGSDSPFPMLFSIPRTGDVASQQFWPDGYGIVQDYLWVADSSGLLVTYYREDDLAVALLPASCVIASGEVCQPAPIATFSVDDSVTLLNAFSPRSRESLLSVRTMDSQTGQLQTDLWVLDLNGENAPRQVTFTPSLIESDAYWASDGYIYFIGSLFDNDMQLLRGRVYRMMDNETSSTTIVFESPVFSPSAFLWWYN